MSRGQRLTMLGIAAAIAVIAVAIAIASGGDENAEQAASSTADETTQTRSGAASSPTTQKEPPTPPPPKVDRIRVENGEPVGGVKDIQAQKGDRVRIAVTSDVAEELHLHGYDISRDVAAGSTSRLNFKADLEGVFELELERSGVPIAELTVNP